jgi:hypothetical protein
LEWNEAFFKLLAHCLPGLDLSEVHRIALAPITSLPDEAFCDAVRVFLRGVDEVHFNEDGLQEPIAISIRSECATRLMATHGWKRLARRRTASIDIHTGEAAAVLFFNDYAFPQPPSCYLLPGGVERLAGFVPVLQRLVIDGPSHFTAAVTLNVLEVSPRPTHLPFLVVAAQSWLEAYANDSDFWVDYGIGRRTCEFIAEVLLQQPGLLDPSDALRADVDRILGAMVSLGVAEARRLEETLAGRSGTGS